MPATVIGVPTAKLISDRLIRITGFAIDTGDTATFANAQAGGDPDMVLPEGFHCAPYKGPAGDHIGIVDAVQVWWAPSTAPGEGTVMPIIVLAKTEGDDNAFSFTLTNTSEDQTSPELEIWVEFH